MWPVVEKVFILREIEPFLRSSLILYYLIFTSSPWIDLQPRFSRINFPFSSSWKHQGKEKKKENEMFISMVVCVLRVVFLHFNSSCGRILHVVVRTSIWEQATRRMAGVHVCIDVPRRLGKPAAKGRHRRYFLCSSLQETPRWGRWRHQRWAGERRGMAREKS